MIEILIIGEIVLGLGIIVGGFFLLKMIAHYNTLVKGTKSENLKEILEQLLEKTKETKEEIKRVETEVKDVKNESLSHIRNASVMRFNPFGDTGGDQSFILMLLNKKNDGVSLTSLHSRGVTRWYAKNIKNGKGVDHELSKEEISAMKNIQEKI